MLDINLLNKRGIYKSSNVDFDKIDESIDKKIDKKIDEKKDFIVEDPTVSNSNVSKNDFESNYDDKKK